MQHGERTFVEDEDSSGLQSIRTVHHIYGYPINISYTDTDALIEALHNTDVHNVDDPSAEFALSVYLHPYPNNIISVWVYVAALPKKRR